MKILDRPVCVPLEAITDEAVGGKAAGLARLASIGLDVPRAFVVIGARPGVLPEGLAEAYASLGGGRVAVRSSAIGEDSADASFAGQFETVLGVEGIVELEAAIERCLASVESVRASAYREDRGEGRATPMVVVVQRMVEARAAGVLFTVDPVGGRRDRWVVDAVRGLGDVLVSGEATPDHYVLDARANVVERSLIGERAILDGTDLHALSEGARRATEHTKSPVDMEWAIDRGGAVQWLQARPVTRLPADPAELDTRFEPSHLYTKCNIGEMMPGAVTPLTMSTTGRGVDVGMQRMYRQIGAHERVTEENHFVAHRFGHLFVDLTAMAGIARYVAGASADAVAFSICGRHVDGLGIRPPLSTPRRIVNGARYAAAILSGGRYRAELHALAARVAFAPTRDPRVLWESIDAKLSLLFEAYRLHLLSSAGAGAAASALLQTIARTDRPTDEDHARLAGLLAGADDVESADIAAGADRIVAALRVCPGVVDDFVDAPPEAALAYLRSDASGAAGVAFARYLERHGHRSVRELEMRQLEWAADPVPLIRSLQASSRAALGSNARRSNAVVRIDQHVDATTRKLIGFAHASVRGREESKAALVLATVRFKGAYRRLGAILAERGSLDDADLVFFLTQQELGIVASGDGAALVASARARREGLSYQTGLVFDDVVRGAPEPRPVVTELGSDSLSGQPVSRGVVVGTARVVRTLEEASAIRPGEILIAPITDVGWTPYFAAIRGLATDIGSAVSHGSVVAREYGLPAVVNLRDATRRFRTGDRVVLDGNRGVLRLAGIDD